jgi:Flp pilus assembly protein TadG
MAGIGRLWRDRSGNVTILVAVALPLILGSVGLGTEAAMLMLKRQQLQKLADAAAYSAAVAYKAGSTSLTTQAQAITAQDGVVDGAGGVTVAAHRPPSAGAYTTNTGAVEVVITAPSSALFSKVFGFASFTITTRAVAVAGSAGSGDGCMLALGQKTAGNSVLPNAIHVNNNGSLNLGSCSLYDNSSDTNALSISNNGAITSGNGIYVVGGMNLQNNARLGASTATLGGTLSGKGNTGSTSTTQNASVSPMTDPYANVTITPPSACTQSISTSNNQSVTKSAGVYCSISLSNNSTLTLNPGIYYIDGGNVTTSNNSTIRATGGVSIVLTSSSGSSYGYFQIDNNSSLVITAPTSGPTSGIAVMQDRRAPMSTYDSNGSCLTYCNNQIDNNGNGPITGAVYFPRQHFDISNNAANGNVCTQVIANSINISNNGTLTLAPNCANAGATPIGGSNTATALVE